MVQHDHKIDGNIHVFDGTCLELPDKDLWWSRPFISRHGWVCLRSKQDENFKPFRMKNQATKGTSDSDKGTLRKGKSSIQESPIKTDVLRWTSIFKEAKEEFLKIWAFSSVGTFGMSNVFSTTFFASMIDVAAISNMKANAVEKLKEKQQCLKAIKIGLDQSKTKRDEHTGLMRGAAKIIERLNKDMEELKLHKTGFVRNEEAMAKLETLIQIRKEALKDMGLDIEVHNLDNLGEEVAHLRIGDAKEPDEMVEDIAANQDAEQDVDVIPDKVEEDQEPTVFPKIEEILRNCPGWGYLVLNFCKIKKLIILDLNGLFVKQDVSKRDPKAGQLEHPPRPAFKRVNEKLWIYYHRDAEQFVWDLRQIADAMIWSSCTTANIELILRTCCPNIWEHRTYHFRYLFSDWQC
ncbi:hypothetical protein L7F22_030074 [Adiantum nelumboides]|nr:hypothetical protein [Adiantum nelumboides]